MKELEDVMNKKINPILVERKREEKPKDAEPESAEPEGEEENIGDIVRRENIEKTDPQIDYKVSTTSENAMVYDTAGGKDAYQASGNTGNQDYLVNQPQEEQKKQSYDRNHFEKEDHFKKQEQEFKKEYF